MADFISIDDTAYGITWDKLAVIGEGRFALSRQFVLELCYWIIKNGGRRSGLFRYGTMMVLYKNVRPAHEEGGPKSPLL